MHHLPLKLQQTVRDWKYSPKIIQFSDESGELLGSGGGIAKAKPDLIGGGHFIALNGDEVILPKKINDLLKFQEFYQTHKPLSLLLTMEHSEAGKKFGAVWVDAHQKVYGFGREKPKNINVDVRPMHFIGVQILSDKVFQYLPPAGEESNILYEGLVAGIAKGESVLSYPLDCHWFETGNLPDFLEATEECLEILSQGTNEYLEELIKELTPNSYLTVDSFGGKIFSASPVNIKRLKGFAVIGENVKLEGNPYFYKAVVEGGQKLLPANYVNQLMLKPR